MSENKRLPSTESNLEEVVVVVDDGAQINLCPEWVGGGGALSTLCPGASAMLIQPCLYSFILLYTFNDA